MTNIAHYTHKNTHGRVSIYKITMTSLSGEFLLWAFLDKKTCQGKQNKFLEKTVYFYRNFLGIIGLQSRIVLNPPAFTILSWVVSVQLNLHMMPRDTSLSDSCTPEWSGNCSLLSFGRSLARDVKESLQLRSHFNEWNYLIKESSRFGYPFLDILPKSKACTTRSSAILTKGEWCDPVSNSPNLIRYPNGYLPQLSWP